MGGHWPSLDTIATGQTAVVAVLLVTQFVPQPHVSSGVADLGGLAYGVPLASFVVMAVSLAAGFGMLLTGASRSGARLRYGVLAVVTLLLAIQPVTLLISADAGRGYSLALVFSAAQLAILAVWWRWSTRPVLVWVLLPVYYLLAAGVWLVFAAHGRASAGTGVVLHGLAAELLLLPLVLVFPILAFSTDWVNRVPGITHRVLLFRDPRGRLRFSRPLPYATAIIAVALLTGEILAGEGLAGGLAAVLVMTVIMTVLIRLAGIDWQLAAGDKEAVDIRRGRRVRDRLPGAGRPRPVPARPAGPPVRHGRGARPGPAGAGRAPAGRRVHPEGPR